MEDSELLKKIREEIAALKSTLLDQEKATYTAAEVLEMAGYKRSNRSFIPFCEDKGWLKATIIQNNGKKLYPRKQYRALRKMLAEGKITVCV